jgi:hypothetical protein
MAMTLAMLVAVMTASSVRKLPKVIWPIESENDRIRDKIDAKTDDMAEKTGLKNPLYTTEAATGGTCERHPGGAKASIQPGNGGFPAAVFRWPWLPVTKASVGCNAGLFDHLGP